MAQNCQELPRCGYRSCLWLLHRPHGSTTTYHGRLPNAWLRDHHSHSFLLSIPWICNIYTDSQIHKADAFSRSGNYLQLRLSRLHSVYTYTGGRRSRLHARLITCARSMLYVVCSMHHQLRPWPINMYPKPCYHRTIVSLATATNNATILLHCSIRQTQNQHVGYRA